MKASGGLGLPPKDFATHGARPLPLGTLPGNAPPQLVPTGIFNLTPRLIFLFWTPLHLHHHTLDHPGLRRILTAPEGFPVHRTRPLSGTKPPSGHPQLMLPKPTPNQDYLTPGALPPRPCFLCWGLNPSDCCCRALPFRPPPP
jgi:hypothetical protein